MTRIVGAFMFAAGAGCIGYAIDGPTGALAAGGAAAMIIGLLL